MSKTAFKTFLCSFSVSMLAISIANRAFFYDQKTTEAPLAISGKNIALFIKKAIPQSHPVKKITLNSLSDIKTTDPSIDVADIDNENEGIIVADELEYEDIPFISDEDVVTLANDAEDQKIFLADVVYSKEKPLESLKIEEDVVYSPPEQVDVALKQTSKPQADLAEAEALPKAVIYSGASDDVVKVVGAEPPAENQTVEKNTEIKTAYLKPDAPVPLSYDKKKGLGVKVNINNPAELNHVAMKVTDAPIESMSNSENKDETNEDKPQEWKQMRDNPWLVARSNGMKKNQFADKNFADVSESEIQNALDIHKNKKQDGVKIASETVKNLIIPLPDKLADNENLMPKLAYPEDSVDARKEKAMRAMSLRLEKAQQKFLTEIDDEPEMSMIPPQEEQVEEEENDQEKGLFSSLGAMLKSAVKSSKGEDADSEQNDSDSKSKSQARQRLRKAAAANRNVAIIPKEIKMSFQPNRAEISGQTLKWVQAFALKAAKENNTYLEVRLDGTRPSELQRRRLNLLYNILTNKGVEYSKINVLFTAREANSFILRMVDLTQEKKDKDTNKYINNYAQW